MSDHIAQAAARKSGLRGARRRLRQIASSLLLGAAVLGCTQGQTELTYLGEKGLEHYKSMATTIDYPAVDTQAGREVTFAQRPRTVLDREKDEVWDISLAETIQLAIQNNSLIRSRADNRTPSAILSAGDRAPSVYDPAIQETGVLFGGRGVEAALAEFDAQLNTSMTWGRNETPQNNSFFGGGVGPGSVFVNETGAFDTQLSKIFASGGSISIGHQMNYSGNNSMQLFPSAYTGNVNARYRHPLLAGSGTEFTRIAGPITQNFRGLSGVNQGVLIARINQDISLADFESGVITMLKDVEDLYWELSLSYHEYDTTVTARNSALQSWREAHRILEAGGKQGFKPSDEAQARDFYFQARAAAEASLSSVYSAEVVLRRILGLPVNDGRILRPSDEPATALFRPSWDVCLTEALTQRVELRRQKWSIKSLQLQLGAAENLTRPRFDFVSGYQVNTLGDKLFGEDRGPGTPDQFHSAYAALTQGNLTGWNLGFEFQLPLGLRAAHAQVRNIELRLAKARDQLTAQEMEISHELAQDFQNLAVQHVTAQTNFNRYRAAHQRVQLFKAEVEAGTKTFDVLLRALSSQAEAEVAYYRSLIEYNKAITALHYRKGTLLPHDQVWLSESEWTPDAYKDALRQAWARTHAFDAPHLDTEPAEFVQQPNWSASESAPAGGDAPPVQATPPESVPYENEFPIPPPRPASPKPPTEKDAFAE
jgi:outer membrane protein TolC